MTADQGISSRELLADWLKFSANVQPSCATGDDWLRDLKERTEAAMSAPLPPPAKAAEQMLNELAHLPREILEIRCYNAEQALRTAVPPPDYRALLQACVDGWTQGDDIVSPMKRARDALTKEGCPVVAYGKHNVVNGECTHCRNAPETKEMSTEDFLSFISPQADETSGDRDD